MSDTITRYNELEEESNWHKLCQEADNHLEEKVDRKKMPVFSGVIKYFPDAILEVSKASYIGQQQHNPDKPLAWDRSKSGDELDAMMRHLIDYSKGIEFDEDGVRSLTKCCWRLLAMLQKSLENNK